MIAELRYFVPLSVLMNINKSLSFTLFDLWTLPFSGQTRTADFVATLEKKS